MTNSNETKQVRTLRLSAPDRDWSLVASALCHEAKNLYNITTFLIRQVHSAYQYLAADKSYALKQKLHPHQADAIAMFNKIIDQVNDKRRAKAQNLDKFQPIARLEPLLVFSPFASILHRTVIDNAVRSHLNEHGECVYRKLPAVAAQQVVLSVVDVWKASLAAQKDYAKAPSKYTGRPRFPSFLGKKEHFAIEFPMAVISQSLPKPKNFVKLNDSVSVAMLEQFYSWNLRQAVVTACSGRGWTECDARHVRISVEGQNKVRIELVVHIRQDYPLGSMLYQIYQEHGEAIRDIKKLDERNKFLIAAVQGIYQSVQLNMAGIDFGVDNVAALCFSTGHRAKVYDGDRFVAMSRDYEARLDRLIASLITPRMKELQAKKGLAKSERIELRKAFKEVYANPDYKSLIARRNRRKTDFEHKLTSDIVEQCVANKMHVLVIGLNKGWKSGSDIGRKNNRSFHGIAHSRLIELIHYKADAYGIVVLTTEESYTSKTSFVDGDELRSFAENKETEQLADAASKSSGMSGYRSTKNRNWFVRRTDVVKQGEAGKIHADVNGAFNIIRKVFKDFCYHAGLSLKFTVRWISPRRGAVVPLACL